MQQGVELARVEPGPAAGRAGVDGDAVQIDAVQIVAALRALHPVRLLELLFVGRGHLGGVFLRPLLLPLHFLPGKVLVFATAGLSVLGHALPPAGDSNRACAPRAAGPARTESTRRAGRARKPRGPAPPARATARPAPPTAAPRPARRRGARGACSSATGRACRRPERSGIPRRPPSRSASPRRGRA